jgi:hypothetical protein
VLEENIDAMGERGGVSASVALISRRGEKRAEVGEFGRELSLRDPLESCGSDNLLEQGTSVE